MGAEATPMNVPGWTLPLVVPGIVGVVYIAGCIYAGLRRLTP